MRRRCDLAKYASSVAELYNFFVRKGGGASNRSGTILVYGARPTQEPGPYDDAGPPIGAATIAVPWDSATSTDSYVMEFGNGFIRFTKNGALVTVDSVTDWSNATAYVIGDLATFEGANYYCILAHTGHQPPNATYWYALSGYEYSIPTPYTSTLLGDRGSFCFAQDTDRMLITHGSLLPRELVRVSDTRWTLTAWDVDASSPTRYGIPRIAAPTNLAASDNGSTNDVRGWAVTAITEDLEESLPAFVSAKIPPNRVELTWTASTFIGGATGTIKGYNIYKQIQGVYLYIGFASGTSFEDVTYTPAINADSPPETRSELNTTSGTFPKKVGTFDGRTVLGNFSFNIQAGYASRIGHRQNFTRRFPAAADDSILFQLRGKKISGIRHFVDIGALIAFADSGEWVIEGSSSGALTPTDCYPHQYGGNGASGEVWPIVIGSKAIYVQAQGSILRALGFVSQGGGKNGFQDDDLTAFAEHLFQGFTIVSMSYQKTPHSILWAVRDDGKLIGLTYIPDQQILAYHLHETDGVIEDVCCIPENGIYAVYLIVKRTINGTDVRYMERMADREIDDIEDAMFLDCALSYDGRNTSVDTMTISGGTNWDNDELLTLTSTQIIFSALEIGNEIWLTGADDVIYRCAIEAYTTDKIVSVRPDKTISVASGLRNTATTNWARAVDTISGLDHLEAKEVGVFADGNVVASPNNDQYDVLTVASGSISLGSCHAHVHVGLPFISDIETLDIDSVNSETMINKNKLITGLDMDVEKTRGLFAGPKAPSNDDVDPLERLVEVKPREDEDYAEANGLQDGTVDLNIDSEWNGNGRVFIRQVDPLPVTILSIAPSGLIPFRQGGG